MWIKSSNNKPFHCVDKDTIVDDDMLRISISKRMAENNIAIEVPESELIKSFINQGLISLEIDEKTIFV